ncbi:SusC/RagA family TonB-linked outer membrane protein [Mucilaginibacter gossypii]|uniref:TonB-linked outer membrane protein, SusC/RagA family n=1 Tax=Mucilaginibacter gossypii TaxID=551996 RepID=A0A1G8BBA1_9SPHI|nr:TonB-dependent receptor [Mucilaginibacter gossypii]SDH30361.1 TonB-linked outer membrane protein, SusC/RagA family [Mucilaginibacter gossypii]
MKKSLQTIQKKPFLLLLAVLLSSLTAFGQGRKINGTVVDEKGLPLPGATVRAKTAKATSVTDVAGNFTITVPPTEKALIVTFIGYADQEIQINGESHLSIRLSQSSNSLNDVIVIGYGSQRWEAVTGSVASISGERIRDIPAPNISQAIQGRLPGVEVSQTSTKPGATMQILIRGQRSLTASNDPLIVLDGIPFTGSLGDINPNDVKSIDILKDASATAIYGSRGANGVVLITTNRGQVGGAAKITYNAYYGEQKLFARYPMMTGPEFLKLRKAAGLYTNAVDEADDVNTDWQKLFYRSGMVFSNDVGVSGGSQTGTYNFGGGYYKNQGLIPTQQYTRYSMRGSVDQNVGKYVKVGFTTNNNYNLTEGSQVGVGSVLGLSPLANPYNADGSLKRTVKTPLSESFVLTKGIINNLHDQWLNETRNYATYNSVYGEVKIPWVEGLKYRVNLGLDYVQSNNGNYTGVGIGSATPTTPSTAGVSNSAQYHWAVENLLTYDHTFAQKHNINVVALYSTEQTRYNSSSMSAKDIPADAFQFYNLGAATGEITIGNGNYSQSGLMSYMGRVMYSYDDRFLLSATVRSDASSRLAPGHKWHTYPAVSAGWNIMNESFMKGISVIDNLKLRAGFGQTSNQAVNAYQTLGTLGTRQYNFGDTNYATGYYVTQLPSPTLGWEYSKTWNYGIDFSLFKHRLSGTVEYYVTNTNDILLGVGLPPTAGVGSYTANVGRTQNKGLELSLNGTLINKNGFTWDLGINIYGNRNKLVALASGQTRDEGNAWFVGHNINAIYDYKKIGLWQSGDPYLSTLEPGGNVGMIKVLYTGTYDANGQPTRAIGAADRQIIDVDPKFEGGFNTRVAYKGFDFSVVGAFKKGGTLISSLYGSGGYLNLMTGRSNNVQEDYWTPDNTGAKYPKPGGILSGDNPKYGSTLGYFDASYLKIRTMTLGYDFSKLLSKHANMRLRTYFTVQNPFVFFSPYHKESGMDPEPNSYGNENAAVPLSNSLRRFLTVGSNAPSTTNYVLGLNLTF